jgi:guanine deaminase
MSTLNEAYKAAQLNRYSLSPAHAFYLATRGAARAMYIEDKVGSLAPGMEADIVVLDMKSTPLIRYRMEFAKDILDALFVQMIAWRRSRGQGDVCRRPAAIRQGRA